MQPSAARGALLVKKIIERKKNMEYQIPRKERRVAERTPWAIANRFVQKQIRVLELYKT